MNNISFYATVADVPTFNTEGCQLGIIFVVEWPTIPGIRVQIPAWTFFTRLVYTYESVYFEYVHLRIIIHSIGLKVSKTKNFKSLIIIVLVEKKQQEGGGGKDVIIIWFFQVSLYYKIQNEKKNKKKNIFRILKK